MTDTGDDAARGRGHHLSRGSFCDVRGSAAFAECWECAAAAKVEQFLDIARRAIAGHEGAEIKTKAMRSTPCFRPPRAPSCAAWRSPTPTPRGTPRNRTGRSGWASASMPARRSRPPRGTRPRGQHRGSAVRCCQARRGPGQLDGEGHHPVEHPGRVHSSGQRRLKGISDPIVVYAVSPTWTPRRRARSPRSAVIAGGVAMAAITGSS